MALGGVKNNQELLAQPFTRRRIPARPASCFRPMPAKLEVRISGPGSSHTLRELSAEGQRRLNEEGEVIHIRETGASTVLLLAPDSRAFDPPGRCPGLTQQSVARSPWPPPVRGHPGWSVFPRARRADSILLRAHRTMTASARINCCSD